MKRIILTICMMFVLMTEVYAIEEIPELEIINKTDNSITLKVNVDGVDKDDVCYIHRSIDDINYDSKMIVDCNKMYVDSEVESGVLYYYKASVGNGDIYSEVVSINTMDAEDILIGDKELNNDPFEGLIVFVVTVLLFFILLIGMLMFKKKLNKTK